MKNLKESVNTAKKLKASRAADNEILPQHLEGSMTMASSKIFLNKVVTQVIV